MATVEVLDATSSARRQSRMAGALLQRGWQPGDRLGLCLASSGLLLDAIGAASRVGIVPVVASAHLVAAERAVIRGDADVRAWIDDRAGLMALTEGPAVDVAPFPRTRPMHYTSGTTGRPKGVYSGVLSDVDASAWWQDEIDLWEFDADDVHLVCSPLHHSAPIRFALATLLVGGTVVIPGPFEANSTASAARTHRATTTFLTPAHLQRLDDSGRLGDLAHLRLVAHAGAPCPDGLKQRSIIEIGSDRLWEFYGSTEGQFTVCRSSEWLERPGTVGKVRRGRSMWADADGVLWCRPPSWARWTYWRDEERTDAAWADDAFTVGDLGRFDDEDNLFVSGRRSDLIISGGVNVYPAEVELVISGLAGVRDVVVFGRPDVQWGTRVCVAVVGEITEAAVAAHAGECLASFKRPKEIHIVESIPRAGLAKVRRNRVAADLGLEPPHEERRVCAGVAGGARSTRGDGHD